MTHDELLAKIDNNLDNEIWLHNLGEALRAVIELHRPMENSPYCEHCCLSGFEYPCFTIQAIEKELA